tara:strand:+ start:80 stop:256 length:177 start_codon:yes stop_codon:yes gene_type:complete
VITTVPHPQQTRLTILKEEVELLKEQIRPHDTGHIHTAISVLNHQISEIEETTNYETE